MKFSDPRPGRPVFNRFPKSVRNRISRKKSKRLSVETLESRAMLAASPAGDFMPGDSNGDASFNSADIVVTLQANKYESGETASFSEGDWNRDGTFDSQDLILALQTGAFGQTEATDPSHNSLGSHPPDGLLKDVPSLSEDNMLSEELLRNIGEDARNAGEIAGIVDGLLGNGFEPADIGLGVGGALADGLGQDGGSDGSGGLVPDPMTGLTDRQDDDNDPTAALRPSFDLNDHLSGIASSEKEVKPKPVPGTEESGPDESGSGGTQSTYTESDGTRVTVTVIPYGRGGVWQQTTRVYGDRSQTRDVIQTDSMGVFRSHEEIGPDGVTRREEGYLGNRAPLDRTQDPEAETSSGGFAAPGENRDFSLPEPDRVNPGPESEETVDAPKLEFDPGTLLVNPNPDAENGPDRQLDGPLPPLTSPDKVNPLG